MRTDADIEVLLVHNMHSTDTTLRSSPPGMTCFDRNNAQIPLVHQYKKCFQFQANLVK